MFTRIAPIFAVAYWVSVHSAQFGAQIPTRSPLAMPISIRPSASASTSAASSAYVQRRTEPLPPARSTRASRSPNARTAASKLPPIVSPSSGVTDSPDE